MGSANSTELGILGTNETGETPAWKQYIFVSDLEGSFEARGAI